ncbi:hypothetical protein SUGI_0806240 [Cryptomeria japonica]|nr:hypothetical protein SUGI_0806240 [Cryptomeria japonica]
MESKGLLERAKWVFQENVDTQSGCGAQLEIGSLQCWTFKGPIKTKQGVEFQQDQFPPGTKEEIGNDPLNSWSIDIIDDVVMQNKEFMEKLGFFIKWGGFRWKSQELINNWCKEKWGVNALCKPVVNSFYLVTLASMEDKQRTLSSSPLFMDGAQMHLFDWIPGFNPKIVSALETEVWLRIYNLPSKFWGDGVLKSTSNKLGNFLYLDNPLEDQTLGTYFRICVYYRGKDPIRN